MGFGPILSNSRALFLITILYGMPSAFDLSFLDSQITSLPGLPLSLGLFIYIQQ